MFNRARNKLVADGKTPRSSLDCGFKSHKSCRAIAVYYNSCFSTLFWFSLHTIHLQICNFNSLMLGFMLTTFFLSMWISNTASTAMMLPIVEAVFRELKADSERGFAKVRVNKHDPMQLLNFLILRNFNLFVCKLCIICLHRLHKASTNLFSSS